MENRGQIFHQLPEIHPLVGGEVEENLAAVEGHLRRHQLHIQPMGGDFVQAHVIGSLFLGSIVRGNFLVLSRGLAQNFAQRRHHVLLGDFVVASRADAVLRPPGGVDDHMLPGLKSQAVGVKIVDFLSGAKLDVHDLHGLLRRNLHFLFHIVSFIVKSPDSTGRRRQWLQRFRNSQLSQPQTAAGETLLMVYSSAFLSA